jgi:hypothetical protein
MPTHYVTFVPEAPGRRVGAGNSHAAYIFFNNKIGPNGKWHNSTTHGRKAFMTTPNVYFNNHVLLNTYAKLTRKAITENQATNLFKKRLANLTGGRLNRAILMLSKMVDTRGTALKGMRGGVAESHAGIVNRTGKILNMARRNVSLNNFHHNMNLQRGGRQVNNRINYNALMRNTLIKQRDLIHNLQRVKQLNKSDPLRAAQESIITKKLLLAKNNIRNRINTLYNLQNQQMENNRKLRVKRRKRYTANIEAAVAAAAAAARRNSPPKNSAAAARRNSPPKRTLTFIPPPKPQTTASNGGAASSQQKKKRWRGPRGSNASRT